MNLEKKFNQNLEYIQEHNQEIISGLLRSQTSANRLIELLFDENKYLKQKLLKLNKLYGEKEWKRN